MGPEPMRGTIRDYDDDEDEDHGTEVLSYYKSVRGDTIARPSEIDLISNNSLSDSRFRSTK